MLVAWSLYESNRHLDLIDPSLSSFDEQQATRMLGVALLCVQASPTSRPAMSRVIAMLSGDVEVTPVTTKPSYLTDWDFNDITNTFDDEEPISSENTTMTTATTTTTTNTTTSTENTPTMLSEVMNNGNLREGR
ncbi:putative non-specific serine/threonine protein kinase [Helianthus anomalus]